MPIFKPITENEASKKVKEVYEDIKKTRSITEIPNFWKMLANDSNELERTWDSLKEIMKKGALDPVTKELIYVAVSITNGCEYCIKSHSFAAKKKGATDEMLKEMFAVVGLANKNNKLVDSYQVEVDEIYK
jgi:AhpD family alkylhydroperoxidase